MHRRPLMPQNHRQTLKLMGGAFAAGLGTSLWPGSARVAGGHYDCIIAGVGVSGVETFDYQSAFSYLRGAHLMPDMSSADLP